MRASLAPSLVAAVLLVACFSNETPLDPARHAPPTGAMSPAIIPGASPVAEYALLWENKNQLSIGPGECNPNHEYLANSLMAYAEVLSGGNCAQYTKANLRIVPESGDGTPSPVTVQVTVEHTGTGAAGGCSSIGSLSPWMTLIEKCGPGSNGTYQVELLTNTSYRVETNAAGFENGASYRSTVTVALPAGSSVSLDVPFFSQRDDRWGSQEYDSAREWAPPDPPTIAYWGCNLTSIAMLLQYYGITTLPECKDNRCPDLVGLSVDPSNLNTWLLLEPFGYQFDGLVNPYAVVALAGRAETPLAYRSLPWDPVQLKREIDNGYPAIVDLDLGHIGLEGSHFVVASGFDDSDILVEDPDLRNAERLFETYGPTHRSIRTYTPVQTEDLSAIILSISPPIALTVTGPEAHPTAASRLLVPRRIDTPSAEYFLDAPLASDGETGATSGPGARGFHASSPGSGTYVIHVASDVLTEYQIAAYTLDRRAHPSVSLSRRTIDATATHTYLLGYSPEPGGETLLQLEVPIDIEPGSATNPVQCRNRNGVVPVAVTSTAHFDATELDHATVRFAGAAEVHLDKKTGAPRRHEEDVNGDDRTDLVFHFRLSDTSLQCDDVHGTLTGRLRDGLRVMGSDAIAMVNR